MLLMIAPIVGLTRLVNDICSQLTVCLSQLATNARHKRQDADDKKVSEMRVTRTRVTRSVTHPRSGIRAHLQASARALGSH